MLYEVITRRAPACLQTPAIAPQTSRKAVRDIILEVFMATSSGRWYGAGWLLAATLLLAATPVRAQSGPNDLRASVMAGTDFVRYGLSQNVITSYSIHYTKLYDKNE